MKIKLFPLFAFVFGLHPSLAAAGAGAAPAEENVQIGAYYLAGYAQTTNHVRDARACGLDFIAQVWMMGSHRVFDDFSREGLWAIGLEDLPRRPARGAAHVGHAWTNIAPCLAKMKAHPAIRMFDLIDEPCGLDLPHYGELVRLIRKRCDWAEPFVNLFPNYARVAANSADVTKSQLGTRTYAEYLNAYSENVPLDYLAYDYYVYSAGPENPTRLVPGMFENFRNAADVCRRTGRRLWYTPQVNSLFPDRWISANQLRYQAFTAMCFGAETIVWACYTAGWWHNQVLDKKGEKTEQYEKLRTVNREIKTLGEAYMRYRPLDAAFVGFSGAATNWMAGVKAESRAAFSDGFFTGVRTSKDTPIVVGTRIARSGDGRSRALFIAAVDDPLDEHPQSFDLLFRTHLNVTAVGPDGPVPAARDGEGRCRVPFKSNSALLIRGERP